MSDFPLDTVRRPLAVAHALGTVDRPTSLSSPKLKGRCPDGERCRYQQTPCVEQCSRLQATEIAAELQANARAQHPAAKKAAI